MLALSKGNEPAQGRSSILRRDRIGGTPDRRSSPISRSHDVLGGTPVFAGTRVPVQTPLDYLAAGESIDDFLEGFPSVTREQIVTFLELAKDRLIEVTP